MIQVVCAVIIENNKLLICLRGAQQSNAGLWEFPGGKVKSGEPFAHALKREIKEELNILVDPTTQLPSFTSKHSEPTVELIPFLCNSFEGNIIMYEHAQVQLIELSQLLNYNFTPADVFLCKYLINNPQILQL